MAELKAADVDWSRFNGASFRDLKRRADIVNTAKRPTSFTAKPKKTPSQPSEMFGGIFDDDLELEGSNADDDSDIPWRTSTFSGPRRGKNITHLLKVTLEDLYNGKTSSTCTCSLRCSFHLADGQV
jgi:DnaJ-class molecular chaperone